MVVRKFNASSVEDIINSISPFSIGFDKMFDNISSVADLSNNYPPYNIVKIDDESFMIEFAAAGFAEEEFNIHVVPEGKKLVVQGIQDRGEDTTEYYHRGIGARNFTKTFALNSDIEVLSAEFTNGMLTIKLQHIIPEEKKARKIDISKKILLQE
tara:strand:- start:120 stop:584 length:465 start_codon:yes stop_codon:yes gene_type:complete